MQAHPAPTISLRYAIEIWRREAALRPNLLQNSVLSRRSFLERSLPAGSPIRSTHQQSAHPRRNSVQWNRIIRSRLKIKMSLLKNILVLSLIPVFLSGCATTSCALRETKFVPDNYRPMALLQNEGAVVCEAVGPLPRTHHVYFYLNASARESFSAIASSSTDPAVVSNLFQRIAQGYFMDFARPRSRKGSSS